MMFFRSLVALAATLMFLASPGCAPADPRSRIESAIEVLQSDASGSRKAKACAEIRAALAEYPADAAGRAQLTERAVHLLVRALGDPFSRPEAYETLVSIGIASYEPLFDAVLEGDASIQDGAVTCLIRMSNTAVPVLIPALLGDDSAAQDRAARILTRIGKPISPTLRMYYAKILVPADQDAAGTTSGPLQLSMRGKAGVLAFARVLGDIGDQNCVLALMEGCETLRRAYPDLAAAHLRIIESLGPDAIKSLSTVDRLSYDRLKLMVEMK